MINEMNRFSQYVKGPLLFILLSDGVGAMNQTAPTLSTTSVGSSKSVSSTSSSNSSNDMKVSQQDSNQSDQCLCQLCFTEKDPKNCIHLQCGHVFCKECLKALLNAEIENALREKRKPSAQCWYVNKKVRCSHKLSAIEKENIFADDIKVLEDCLNWLNRNQPQKQRELLLWDGGNNPLLKELGISRYSLTHYQS